MPVWNEHYDLCTQTACPITAGQHSDKSLSEIPKVSGKLVCNIAWKDVSDRELMCIQMTLKLSAGSLRGSIISALQKPISKELVVLPQPYAVDLPYEELDSTSTTGLYQVEPMREKIDNATCPLL
jgi:hypothetical protein